MSQYNAGLVAVTNGSARVIGNAAVDWTEVLPGNTLTIIGSDVFYTIHVVTDPAHSSSGFWELMLTGSWAGDTATNRNYTIVRDFSPVFGFPLLNEGDVETATVYRRFVLMVESLLAAGVGTGVNTFGGVATCGGPATAVLTVISAGTVAFGGTAHGAASGTVTTLAIGRSLGGTATGSASGTAVLSVLGALTFGGTATGAATGTAALIVSGSGGAPIGLGSESLGSLTLGG